MENADQVVQNESDLVRPTSEFQGHNPMCGHLSRLEENNRIYYYKKLEKLEQDRQIAELQGEEFKKKCENWQIKYEKLHHDYKLSMSERSIILRESADLDAKNVLLANQLDEMKMTQTCDLSLHQFNQSIEADLIRLERELNASVNKQEQLRSHNDKLVKYVRQLQEDNQHLTEQLENQTKWRERACHERDKWSADLDEERKKNDILLGDKKSLNYQLEEAIKEKNKVEEKFREDLNKLRKLNAKLESELAATTATIPGASTTAANSHDSAIDASVSDASAGESEAASLQQQQHLGSGNSSGKATTWLGNGKHHSSMSIDVINHELIPSEHDMQVEQTVVIVRCNPPDSHRHRLPLVQLHDRVIKIDKRSTATMSARDLDKILKSDKRHFFTIQRWHHHHYVTRTSSGRAYYGGGGGKNVVTSGSGTDEFQRNRSKRHSIPNYHQLHPSNYIPLQRISNKNDGSNATSNGKTEDDSTTPKKRKPKINLFDIFSKKKQKQQQSSSSTATCSGGGGDSHLTWPRIDTPEDISPPQDRNCVTTKLKKRARPQLTAATYQPPGSSTVVGGGSITSPSAMKTVQPRVRVRTGDTSAVRKMKRPTSAPIDPQINLSMWHEDINLDDVTKPAPSPPPSATAQQSQQASNKQTTTTTATSGNKQATSSSSKISKSCAPLPTTTSPILASHQHHQTWLAKTKSSDSTSAIVDNNHDPPTFRRSTFGRRTPIPRQQSVPEPALKKLLNISGARTLPVDISMSSNSQLDYTLKSLNPRSTRGKKSNKYHQRIRYPPSGSRSLSPNLSNSTISNSNVTINSSQSSPLTTSLLQTAVPGDTDFSTVSLASHSSSSMSSRSKHPYEKTRRITMIKTQEAIGISIVGNEKDGIFISHIKGNSLASRSGLEYGDQLLEVNGLNLRRASEEFAKSVFTKTTTGSELNCVVQQTKKFKESIESNLSDTLGQGSQASKAAIANEMSKKPIIEETITPNTTPRASPNLDGGVSACKPVIGGVREVRELLDDCRNFIRLTGGNKVGIYVKDMQQCDVVNRNNHNNTHINDDQQSTTSIVEKIPDRAVMGDRIITFNGISFCNMTLEHASIILTQQCQQQNTISVVYEPNQYKKVYVQPGDHFYVRALFDQTAKQEGHLEFVKNTILLVDGTLPDYYRPGGYWNAWVLDEQGERTTNGKIPSKILAEKESFEKGISHSSCYDSTSSKRLSGSGRRSFFKRRSKPNRTSSRSSGEVRVVRSTSETSVESAAVDCNLDILQPTPPSYQVVVKSSTSTRRPVVVFGPHASQVLHRLHADFSHCYVRFNTDTRSNSSLESTSTTTQNNNSNEQQQQSSSSSSPTHNISHTTTSPIDKTKLKDFMAKNCERHTLIEIDVSDIDFLHQIMQIYPIIVFIKYKDAKKIKESQDRNREKLTTKQCKDMFDVSNRIEKKLQKYSYVSCPGGMGFPVAEKVQRMIQLEHQKVLWLPSDSNLLKYSTPSVSSS